MGHVENNCLGITSFVWIPSCKNHRLCFYGWCARQIMNFYLEHFCANRYHVYRYGLRYFPSYTMCFTAWPKFSSVYIKLAWLSNHAQESNPVYLLKIRQTKTFLLPISFKYSMWIQQNNNLHCGILPGGRLVIIQKWCVVHGAMITSSVSSLLVMRV